MFALASAAALEPCRAIPEGEDADSKGKSPSLAAPIRLPGESEGGGGDGKPVSLIVQRIPQGGGDPAPADFVVRRGDPALVALAPALREGEKLLRICADEKWPAGFDLEFTFSAPPAKGASVRHAGAAAALAAWALALDKPAPPPDTAVLGDLNADGGLRLAGRIGSAQWAALAFAKRIIVPPAAEEELVDRYLIGGPEACGAAAIFAADRLGDAPRLSQPDPDFEKGARRPARRSPAVSRSGDRPGPSAGRAPDRGAGKSLPALPERRRPAEDRTAWSLDLAQLVRSVEFLKPTRAGRDSSGTPLPVGTSRRRRMRAARRRLRPRSGGCATASIPPPSPTRRRSPPLPKQSAKPATRSP
ncbi:MAG: hypothetical protein R3F11_13315 [Verrucomicrobiales bacterium]